MERLPPQDPPAGPAQDAQSTIPLGPLGPPPPVAQLPPQMFTTAAQLLDLTDSEFYRFGYLLGA
jgi:U6 snRNA-associated Sm-like protein LSm1